MNDHNSLWNELNPFFAEIQTLNWIVLGIDHGYQTLQHYVEEQNLESDNLCCEKLALSDFWRETESCCWVLCVWPRRYATAYAPQHPLEGPGLTWRNHTRTKTKIYFICHFLFFFQTVRSVRSLSTFVTNSYWLTILLFCWFDACECCNCLMMSQIVW